MIASSRQRKVFSTVHTRKRIRAATIRVFVDFHLSDCLLAPITNEIHHFWFLKAARYANKKLFAFWQSYKPSDSCFCVFIITLLGIIKRPSLYAFKLLILQYKLFPFSVQPLACSIKVRFIQRNLSSASFCLFYRHWWVQRMDIQRLLTYSLLSAIIIVDIPRNG